MSGNEEETELRDLLLQTLEKNGVLGKIKAELRAGVFLALESKDQSDNYSHGANRKLTNFKSQSATGPLYLELVQEFLTFFDLDYTNAVFTVEAGCSSNSDSRNQLLKNLNLPHEENSALPVLGQLIQSKQSSKPNLITTPSESHIETAKNIFKEHSNSFDSGLVSKTKAVDALSQLCPEFPRYLLQSFVDDEMRRSTLQNISCITFIQIYEKLFKLCSTITTVSPAMGESIRSSYNDSTPNMSGEFDKGVFRSDKEVEKNLENLLMQDHIGSADYEGDFNSVSQTSISEDLQGDGLLSSAPSSYAELTDDHTLGESNHDMDYTEDI
uniref:FGFR1 oncogene partner-like n=1 Tax=Phallusia mammillata TaxID=59560 RepID=A0A6F9DDE0_9ASCI|nr:FGFR1 oncogene partner-like [Phallusia mammillata]